MNLAARAVNGAMITLTAQWTRFALQLLGLSILARLLEPSDFGLYAMVLVFSGLAALLGDFGLSIAAMQSQSANRQLRSNLLWLSLVIGLCAAIILFAFAPMIASFYQRPEVAGILRIMCFTFIFQAVLGQFRAELARNLKFPRIAISDVSSQVLGLAVAIGLAWNDYGYWALVAQQLSIALSLLVLLAITSHWWPSLPRRENGMAPLLTFAARTGGVQLLNYLTSNVDTLLVGRYYGPATTGAYSQAFQITKVPMTQIATPLTQVAVPTLSRIHGTQAFAQYVQRMQVLIGYALGGAMVAIAALATPIVQIMLGPGWDEVPPIVIALSIGGYFQALGFGYYWTFLAADLTAIQLRVALVTRPAVIGLLFVGVHYGAAGVALAGSCGLALNWLALTVFALPRSGVKVSEMMSASFRPLVVLLPMGLAAFLATRFTAEMGAWGCLVVSLGSALAIGASLWCVPWVRADIRMIVGLAGKIRLRNSNAT